MIWNMSRALVCVGALFGAAPAFGTTIGFDPYAPTNAANLLRITVGGITVIFDSPSSAGAFIAEDGSAFSTLGSSVLADDNFAPEAALAPKRGYVKLSEKSRETTSPPTVLHS